MWTLGSTFIDVPMNRRSPNQLCIIRIIFVRKRYFSDFIWDFEKLPFPEHLGKYFITRFDVYETLCPQQMLVHKCGQIKNWSGECIPTKLQCQTIQRALQSPNLQREIIKKKKLFLIFDQLIYSSSFIR